MARTDPRAGAGHLVLQGQSLGPKASPVVASASVGLVFAAPERPFEGADDGVSSLVGGVEEVAYLRDGEGDQVPGLAGRGVRAGRFCG